MFCNEIEHTLFSPLPPSLWTDYYNDRDDHEADFFRNGVMRNYSPSRKQLLPSLRHFRSLPNVDEIGRKDSNDDEFIEEFDETSKGASSLTSSPIPTHNSGQTVKSLFHDGCLFAYSPPRNRDRDSSFRARMRRAKRSLSPLSRRKKVEPSVSQDQNFSPFRKDRKAYQC